ncbi:MAG: DGQHR domain-containing protein [Bacteroidetes bacterium]|nr:DGQHR domain-containing protein [Bacteroidota bacterium]
MAKEGDIRKLKTSWTKYDAVQVINVITNKELPDYLSRAKKIDQPVLKSVLGIQNLSDPLPAYWHEVEKHPRQLRLFALVAAIFTHYSNIRKFAEKYSKGKMKGVFITEDGKVGTNMRSALVESGAASKEYRREKEVPYDLSPLFEAGEVGKLFRALLQERLERVGFEKTDLEGQKFYKICFNYEFHKALGLTKNLFQSWLDGSDINEAKFQTEYSFNQLRIFSEIKAIKINQWLNDWDDVDFKSPMRRKPEPYYLLFKIDARLLKRISDVHRRKPDRARAEDSFVQRSKNENRTEEIKKYIEGGFPWSTIKKEEQRSPENERLKMPGMLPTAIIANIIGEGEKRGLNQIKNNDLIKVVGVDDDSPRIIIPDKVFDDNWNPDVKPIEIIDGQHRLWAFDENEPISGNYELPVVAFYNLDRTWQAYLFYTINIKPVKINTSLGYDLYPLLRTQEWLERSKEGLLAYRENRAQEIVEVLWRSSNSPWKDRINMLGESGGPTMSQAAFIRALTSTFFKNVRSSNGGLFGDVLTDKNNQVVSWNRAQQGAFIILLWQDIAEAAKNCTEKWAEKLKDVTNVELSIQDNLPFTSKNSMLTRDQGVRGISMFANDFFYQVANSDEWDFNIFEWNDDIDENLLSEQNIQTALEQFRGNSDLTTLVGSFANELMRFDWRTTSAQFDSEEERNNQMRFKGSSGYSEIAKDLLRIFYDSSNSELKKFLW